MIWGIVHIIVFRSINFYFESQAEAAILSDCSWTAAARPGSRMRSSWCSGLKIINFLPCPAPSVFGPLPRLNFCLLSSLPCLLLLPTPGPGNEPLSIRSWTFFLSRWVPRPWVPVIFIITLWTQRSVRVIIALTTGDYCNFLFMVWFVRADCLVTQVFLIKAATWLSHVFPV